MCLYVSTYSCILMCLCKPFLIGHTNVFTYVAFKLLLKLSPIEWVFEMYGIYYNKSLELRLYIVFLINKYNWAQTNSIDLLYVLLNHLFKSLCSTPIIHILKFDTYLWNYLRLLITFLWQGNHFKCVFNLTYHK